MRRAIFFAWFTAIVAARADVTLPHILTEHMVVQRGLPVHIWGKASKGESVAVAFGGNTQSTKADALGRWSVYLAPCAPGGPFTLTIRGNNTIEFHDVLVGDVWVAAGQSNMAFALRGAENGAAEIAAAKFPKIRRIVTEHVLGAYPMEDVNTKEWTGVNPENAATMSAVAYFFARNIHEKEGGIPIGIMESDWGGTPIEAWMSLRSIAEDPALMPIFRERALTLDGWAARQPALAPAPAQPNPNTLDSPNGAYTAGTLYNGMIAPLTPFPIKGVIWYQGETNGAASIHPVLDASLYARAFGQLIRDWRRVWRQGDFPFLFVQLPNFNAATAYPGSNWPELRQAQLETLSVANTAMVVTIDIGNPENVHPTNKQDVGLRLSLAARSLAYGEKIEYSGPTFLKATSEGSALRAWFDHTTGGLHAGRKGGAPALKGFEIAGADRKFVPAEARVDGGSIVLSAPTVSAPVLVRYAWADNPECNLYNGEGLPASPFQSK